MLHFTSFHNVSIYVYFRPKLVMGYSSLFALKILKGGGNLRILLLLRKEYSLNGVGNHRAFLLNICINSLHYHPHDCAFFVCCVNGKEIHKYLVHPYTIFKCFNMVRMSIFNYIFIYFYFQEIFSALGETLEISLEVKKYPHRSPL